MIKQRKARVLVTREVYADVKLAVKEGWTQKKVGKANGVSQATVSKIVNSKNFKEYKASCKAKSVKKVESKSSIFNELGIISSNQRLVNEIKKLLNEIV